MRMKILFLTVACLLLASTSALAFGRIVYPDRPLNLRSARSPKAKWVGSLHPGQKVRVGFEKDGWVAVFEPGETRADERFAAGFSNAKYLLDKRTRYEPEPWGEYVSVARNLNIREKPSVKGRRLDMLKAGEVVKIDFPDGDWTLVFRPDATIRSDMNGIGYASAKYFKPAKGPAPEPAPATEQAKVSPVVEAGSGQGQVSSKVSPPPAPAPVVVPDLPEAATAPAAPLAKAEPEPAAGPKEPVRAPEPAKPAPAPVPASAGKPQAPDVVTETGRKTIVIDRSRFAGAKRADPAPDQTAHGYRYRLLEKSETRKYGVTWITLKVFLSTKVLPKGDALKDFATTLWKDSRRAGKNLAVLIYLPGMDTGDLSYAVIQFDDSRLIEYWVRRTTLFGTEFM
ncbi:SH3 domain-containing protein [Pseudodesulfovibrio sp.]|uniref:SH3 domain-containing protein n=1 Tax=Pseudodesulfovibrio sp. TaxID=2035812 RepID=UPI00262ABB91|nr:SH3 domain-containing protein [Pseudodesulfovibrio sp.]MDD3311508.1 SH3 domain-containing protein [Pseudodesulfovibrio sp.]